MRNFLRCCVSALFLIGGYLSASAAWDFSNTYPITKPSGIEDGKYYYFRAVCIESAMDKALCGDLYYRSGEITEEKIFKVVSAGTNEMSGDPMFYVQNVASGLWWSGTSDGWSIATMEESEPLTFGLASVTTSPDLNDDNLPAGLDPDGQYTMAEWKAAGGDESMADEDIFEINSSYTKIPVWKWRSYQLADEDGDAITFGMYADDWTPGDLSKITFIKNIWGGDNSKCTVGTGPCAINPWYAYEAKYINDAITDLEQLVASYENPNFDYYYEFGTDPGLMNDSTYLHQWREVWNEAKTALDFENYDNITEDYARDLSARLKEAHQMLDSIPRNEMREGYYWIENGYLFFAQKQRVDVDINGDGNPVSLARKKGIYDKVDGKLSWGDMCVLETLPDGKQTYDFTHDRAFLFKVSKGSAEGQWVFQNVLTGRYFNGGNSATSSELLKEQNLYYQTGGYYAIRDVGNTSSSGYYQPYNHGNGSGSGSEIRTYTTGPESSTIWKFREVTDPEFLDSLKNELTQNIIEAALSEQLDRANEAYEAGFDAYITSADQLSSNATDPSEGSLANLIDGNTETFFHSSWHSDVAPDEDHYLQVKLNEPLSKVGIYWYKRTQNHANRPSKITVMGSNDGAEWTQAGILPAEGDTLPWGKATPAYKTEMTFAAPYSYLRFVVNEAKDASGGVNTAVNNGHPYFTFSEFQIYAGLNEDGSFLYNPKSFGYREDLQQAYTDLKAAIDAANAVAGHATYDDVDKLEAAVNAFEAAYPDTTILTSVLNTAKKYYAEAVKVGTGTGTIGTYNSDELHAALNTVATEIETVYDPQTVTRAYINEQSARLQEAIDNFLADINMPELDTWYQIRNLYNGTDREDDANPLGKYIYAPGKEPHTNGVNWGGGDGVAENTNPSYIWRFEDLGDGTFAVRNMGTGYYMGENRGTSSQYMMSDTIVPFKFAYVAGEQLSLSAAASTDDTYRYIHANADKEIVTWSASKDSPSCWAFDPVDFDGTFMASKELSVNGMDIYCFPYTTARYGTMTDYNGTDVKLYTMAGVEKNAEGKVRSIKLNPMEVSAEGIPGGTPFIILAPSEASSDDGTKAIVYLDINPDGPVSCEGGVANGLVGVNRTTAIADGLGFFAGDTQEITISDGTSVSAQSGYIDPRLVTEELPSVDGTITISVSGEGVMDNIKEAIQDANSIVSVTSVDGVVVRQNVKAGEALKGLPKGVYIVGGKKVSVK